VRREEENNILPGDLVMIASDLKRFGGKLALVVEDLRQHDPSYISQRFLLFFCTGESTGKKLAFYIDEIEKVS
tara:strand:- start:605 stop:823 length:219 start_codon:yes stop_codon:yes gene_type:complete